MHETIRVGELSVTFLKTRLETGNSLVMYEMTLPPTTGAPVPHIHRDHDEIILGMNGITTWTLNEEVIELHPGGRWDLDMVDNATGEHYPIRSKLTVVIPPEYLEGSEDGDSEQMSPGDPIVLRIWLHDHGDKTRMTLHQGPFTPEFREMTRVGWESSFVKIDAELEKIQK